MSIRGRIRRPEPLESTVAEVTGQECRAFQTPFDGGLLLLVETSGELPENGPAELVRRMRAAVIREHGLVADVVALVAPGELRRLGDDRLAVLNGYRRGELDVRHSHSLSPGPASPSPDPASSSPSSSADAADAVGTVDMSGGVARPAEPLTYEAVRQAAATVLGLDASRLNGGDDLIRHGLDSMRVMQLANEWRRGGVEVKFADLFEAPTLDDWWELLSAGQDTAGATAAGPRAPEVDESAPFALTPVQHAYWIGRQDRQVLGGVGCHFYAEFDGAGVDAEALEGAVRALFERHALLRARFLDDGTQQILDRSPWPGLVVHDLRLDDGGRLDELRETFSHRRLEVERGEVFDIRLSLLPGGAHRLHVNFDLLVADVRSIQIILEDLAVLYSGRGESLPPLRYGFPTYLAEHELRGREAREKDRAYWRERLADLPEGPQLPLAVEPERVERPRVVRRGHWLPPEGRDLLADHARTRGVTLPMVLAAAFAEVIGAWSAQPRFLLNLPLFDRQTLHPDVPLMVADFTNLILLDVDLTREETFQDRVTALQSRFIADVAHSAYSGVEVLRDLNRGRRGGQVTAPVVLTSAAGMGDLVGQDVQRSLGRLGWMLSQTPQVWLDHQVVEVDGGLLFNWDAVDELFPAGMLDAMSGAFAGLLDWLAEGDWDRPLPALTPSGQSLVRAGVNATAGAVPEGLLHSGFFGWAAREPGRTAVVWDGGELSYGELAGRALGVAGWLRGHGVTPGDAVAVSLPKGPDQAVAVLGVLAAGGVYVPVGVDQPETRKERICRRAGVRLVLTGDDSSAGVEAGSEGGVERVRVGVAVGAVP
ncbi:condensation domain-containing protein, partial [Streptosporangium sp. OZ121]|uniref:condensation domain-containing protein n=1 Tax=Streptosporangium sp. OZ121 TaxID=3444183 RepID=UPI003F794103